MNDPIENLNLEIRKEIDRPDQIDTNGGGAQLEKYSENMFSIFGYELASVSGDILLIQYVDTSTGTDLMRGGLYINTSVTEGKSVWRIGKVVLVGPKVSDYKPGDFVTFPDDKGIKVGNLQVEGIGSVRFGVFLNEERLFGRVKPLTQ